MTIQIRHAKNIEELASFLEYMNTQSKYHVGFIGENKEEIQYALMNDFTDVAFYQSFAVAYKEGQVVGAIGFDVDKENKSAEVWGPFILDQEDFSLAEDLWKYVKSIIPFPLHQFIFFLHIENESGKEFVAKQEGEYKGNHFILQARKESFKEVEGPALKMYHPRNELDFTKLHEETFPGAYYNAKDILNRLNDNNQLLVMEDENSEMKGYAYVETQPEHSQGSVEFIAVLSSYRNQGLGTKIMNAALGHLFAYKGIEEIRLSVKKDNSNAIHLYENAGFKLKSEQVHYEIYK